MRCALQVVALAFALSAAFVSVVEAHTTTNWLPMSWFFDWTPAGAPIAVPITAQCETIHITWSRSTATGPDPVAPYYVQIYTSNFIFPFVIPTGLDPKADITIPFAPGTQYQICMFDSNGNTGGCQAIYTVYANSTESPTCSNFTMPVEGHVLNVKSEAAQGALSMYGWVDSCSDIKVTPQGGTPPFTFTVAPALHPPFNITSNDMSAINWTVALSWASPFFISLVDSTGLTWSNGPLHSGNGKTDCLSMDSSSQRSGPSVGASVGAAIGGLAFGIILSLLATFLVFRHRKTVRQKQQFEPTPFGLSNDSFAIHPYTTLQSPPPEAQTPTHQHHNSISDPKQYPRIGTVQVPSVGRTHGRQLSQDESIRYSASASSLRSTSRPRSSPQSPTDVASTQARSGSSADRQEGSSQVYVIHHDSGRAPVSVITAPGTEVVELPPGYSADFSRDGRSSLVPPATSERRRGKSPVRDSR